MDGDKLVPRYLTHLLQNTLMCRKDHVYFINVLNDDSNKSNINKEAIRNNWVLRTAVVPMTDWRRGGGGFIPNFVTLSTRCATRGVLVPTLSTRCATGGGGEQDCPKTLAGSISATRFSQNVGHS